MKKKDMPYKKRTAAAVTLLILSLAAAAAIYIFGIKGLKVSKTVQAASYSSKSEITYEPHVIDDPYYNEENIDFGTGYITKYVDRVDLGFLYSFKCDTAAEISGNYEAAARLEAVYNDTDVIWSKEYPLVPKTGFITGASSVSAVLPLKDYVELAEAMKEYTGVICSVTLTVTYSVNASAVINGEEVSDDMECTLALPVSGDVFAVSGSPVSEHESALEEELSRRLLPKREALTGGIILFILFSGSLLCLLLLTRGVRDDPLKLRLNRIYKKYGGRIVGVRSDSGISSCDEVYMSSFDGLLLTADEMKKPIFKTEGSDIRDTEFFVQDKSRKYVFNFRAPDVFSGREESSPGQEGRKEPSAAGDVR